MDGKIFFVLGSFKLGGTERTASRIGLELIRRGYDVKFLLINGIFDYNDELLVKNAIVLSKPKSTPGAIKLISVYLRLLKIVWQERPHRLLSFSLGINLLIFFLFYPKTVFRIESNIFNFKRRLYRRYLQNLFSLFPHVKRVVIPSRGLFEASFGYFKANRKLVLISNPLDVENITRLQKETIGDFLILQSSPYIVSAGRLNASKGFEQLIRVYKESKLFPDFKMAILGQGPFFKRLHELIESEGLTNHVILTGYQSNPYRFFCRARFFVLNSSHESFGNVLIESFACNIPVMSNDCDFGPRHIITHEYNGLLYQQSKEKEFIRCLELLAFDEHLYQHVKKGAIDSVATYDVEVITDQWVREIIENRY